MSCQAHIIYFKGFNFFRLNKTRELNLNLFSFLSFFLFITSESFHSFNRYPPLQRGYALAAFTYLPPHTHLCCCLRESVERERHPLKIHQCFVWNHCIIAGDIESVMSLPLIDLAIMLETSRHPEKLALFIYPLTNDAACNFLKLPWFFWRVLISNLSLVSLERSEIEFEECSDWLYKMNQLLIQTYAIIERSG